MRRRWVIPALVVALAGTTIWGIAEYRVRRAYELQAENNYQRAFHELAYHVDGVEKLLTRASAVNSPGQVNRVFGDIWRQSYSAQQMLAQLPLTNANLAKTRSFLAKLLSFSSLMTQRAIDGQKYTQAQFKTTRDLKKQAEFLTSQISSLQSFVFESGSRFIDESATRTADVLGAQGSNIGQITRSFIMVEDGLKQLPDPSFDGNTLNIKARPTGLTGPDVNMDQALDKARRFLAPRNISAYRFDARRQPNTDLPGYAIEGTPPRGDGRSPIRMVVTRKGGIVLWMLEERTVRSRKISVDQAIRAGQQFLESHGYSGLQVAMVADYQNIATINYVSVVNDAYVYPDVVKLQVARDNGQVLSFDASSYVTFHKKRNVQATLTPEQARAKLNPNVKVVRVRKAIILDNMFREILCYECEGTVGTDRVLVYINAANGREEKVRRITSRGVIDL